MSSELTAGHLEDLIRLLNQSRETPGYVQLPREGVNLMLAEIDRLRATVKRVEALCKCKDGGWLESHFDGNTVGDIRAALRGNS